MTRRPRPSLRLVQSDDHQQRWVELNIGTTEAVEQHYVSRFYLRRFTDSKGRLPAFDLLTGRRFFSAPGRAAKEQGFNDFDLQNLRVSTESWLAELEADAAPLVAHLVENPSALTSLRPEEERVLARYIAAQRLRVPSQRESYARTRHALVSNLKQFAQAHLRHDLPEEKADEIWAEWEAQPDEWWLQQDEPIQDAETTAFLLSGLEGWSNLFRAMPWRIGTTRDALCTSDNPVSAFAYSTFPFGNMRAVYDYIYYFPLSTDVLLRLGPPVPSPSADGPRERRDFGLWETSVARHVVASDATHYLFGPSPYIDRKCAADCLTRLNRAKLHEAVRYQGFDPTPPGSRPMPPDLRGFGQVDVQPDERGLYEVLFDFLAYKVPLSAVTWWLPELVYMASHQETTRRRRELVSNFVRLAYATALRESAVRAAAEGLSMDLFPAALQRYVEETGSSLSDILGLGSKAPTPNSTA